MKVMFLDWAGWVYKKPHYLREFLAGQGVECVNASVAPFQFGTMQEPKTPLRDGQEAKKEHRGFNLESMITRAVYKDLKWYDWDRARVEYRLKEAEIFIDWAFETFEKVAPDYIVVEGGLTHFSRPFVEVARDLGIGVIALENTFIKDKIIIDFDTGCVCNRHLFARTAKDWLGTRVLTTENQREVDGLITALFRDGLRYPTKGDFPEPEKPYIFVPLQVYNDQVTVFDSKYNNEQFILAIMNLASFMPDRLFYVKCHPKEERVRLNRETGDYLAKQRLPDNVLVIRDGKYNTQDMMRGSEAVIVNNTQAGLEAALLGSRVYVAGDAFYHGHGFTYSLSEFGETFERRTRDGSVNQPAVDKARLFLYYFHRWLYNHQLTLLDEERIRKRLNI